jgi:hypothetical protein
MYWTASRKFIIFYNWTQHITGAWESASVPLWWIRQLVYKATMFVKGMLWACSLPCLKDVLNFVTYSFIFITLLLNSKVKGKAIPVTGHEDRNGCEMLRLPHFLNNRLADGGEVVSFTRRPPFTPRKIPGTHFCYRPSRPQGHSAAGRIRSIEKSNDLIGNRTRDLPACSIVPQPTTLLCAPD